MDINKIIKSTIPIFNLDVITKFINLYISLLAFVALLITIGWFNISNRPKIEILEPFYFFDMTRINNVLSKYNQYNIFPILPELNNKFCMYDTFELGYHKTTLTYQLPYHQVDAKNYQREQCIYEGNFLYHTGIIDDIDTTEYSFNTSALRTEEQKRIGLYALVCYDAVSKFTSDSFKAGPSIKANPLVELYKKKNSIRDKDFDGIFSGFMFAMPTIYSIISIGNYSGANIKSLNVFVNDVKYSGMLEIIGWTEGFPNVDLKSRGPNFRLDIEDLPKNQSVEILFRGSKKIREHDIKISSPLFANLNNCEIIIVLSILFLLETLLFLADKKRRRVATVTNKGL